MTNHIHYDRGGVGTAGIVI